MKIICCRKSMILPNGCYIRVKNTYHKLEENVWSLTFHEQFGPCHRLDVSKSKMYQGAQAIDHVYVGYGFKSNVSWPLTRIFLHSRNNFPDSAAINPNYFLFSSQLSNREWLDLKLIKSRTQR